MAQAISIAQLRGAQATTTAPVLLDIRRAAVFEQADSLISGAAWRDPEQVLAWAGGLSKTRPVVVYCVHGHEVSQQTADKLASLGIQASFLKGGIEDWKAAGGPLSLRRPS
jgi:Fe-Mn family superoxide dismutase